METTNTQLKCQFIDRVDGFSAVIPPTCDELPIKCVTFVSGNKYISCERHVARAMVGLLIRSWGIKSIA